MTLHRLCLKVVCNTNSADPLSSSALHIHVPFATFIIPVNTFTVSIVCQNKIQKIAEFKYLLKCVQDNHGRIVRLKWTLIY